MQTQLIAITRTDGSLVLMQFVLHQPRHGDDPGWDREPTPENVEAEIAKAGIADVQRWRLIQPEDVPTSREHRNRWRDTGTEIVVEEP
jgi:hypothetical protein